ncbi:hypothetical protein, partial [Pseudomonas sp. 43(2021)]|uniref:hypothetical protein n=1 Tax=Pseudomonas sp. 43(2021) TaxID=2813560 RepID=UPI001A9E71F5
TLRASLVPIPDILIRFKLSQFGFTRLFISTGFVTPININGIRHLLKSEAGMVDDILSNHYTYSGSDKILGQGETRRLITAGKLKLANFSNPKLASSKLVRRSDVTNVLIFKI